MPELPEVESIKLQLAKLLKGHEILSVKVNTPKVVEGDTTVLVGGAFKTARRFGKVVCIDLSNGYSFIVHVKLTGQLIYRGPNLNNQTLSKKVFGGVPGKHTHVVFEMDKGAKLFYNDYRRFGWIKIFPTDEVENSAFIKKLGPEPFGSTKSKPALLTLPIFRDILSKSRRAVKLVLIDQSKMGGVGNIYANDALWLATINPRRSASDLREEETKKLYDAILEVLKKGIKEGGASELAFVTPDGSEGNYQNHTLAYGRTGELCKRCKKDKIVKDFLGGRGTYYCPNCQK